MLLAGLDVTIGRDAKCELSLQDGTVSRRHLALKWDPRSGRHVAYDLGSRNGSFVDGAPIREMPRVLEDNEVLQIGDVLAVYERHVGGLAEASAATAILDAIPGEALSIRALRERVVRVAGGDAPVLVTGETGSGKERISGLIHALSGRRGPLLAVNCGALSPHLCEGLLFGHERGVFTGAEQARPGLFRAADGGTLFLDEIGELPRDLQCKLLRAVGEGRITPVGSTREQRVDVRIVAATHRDLSADIENGLFRRDLYARLAPQSVWVPSLRQRRVDIFSWLARFLQGAARAKGLKPAPSIEFGPPAAAARLTPSAAAAILGANWLDNLRGLDRLANELVHHIDEDAIGTAMLPPWLLPQRRHCDPNQTLPPRPPQPTPDELKSALLRFDGNISKVARLFGRDRSLIRRWMDRYRIAPVARAVESDSPDDDVEQGDGPASRPRRTPPPSTPAGAAQP